MDNFTEIKLEDFCVMEEFWGLLENWTNTTGISTRAVDMQGESISPSFGMAEYCRIVTDCEEGMSACLANWKSNKIGLYECHAGFFDFAVPIETPDGIQLGRVLAGQVLSSDQPIEQVIEKAKKYNIPADKVREVVGRTRKRSQEELESIYTLLKQMVDMFIEKSYQKWYENKQLYNVVATAEIGLWRLTLADGKKPQLTGSDKMLELLGMDNDEMSDEEKYEEWHSRVKDSEIPSVEGSVSEMMHHIKSENVYIWNHPTLGERYIRCGGIGEKVKGVGYVLCGYHMDITDIVSKENKQKQLLSDALNEAERQKKLLQEALDNFKQADYDRRTDFLTGLKNRQDMYEILNDETSSVRDRITAVFMLDVDNFKMFNDNYGHLAGDDCLRKIGKALIEYGEKNQMYFFRYGGEEMLGLSLSSEKSADDIANELVKLIFNLNIKRDDLATGAVTVSLGYTTEVHDREKMIDKADVALYESKSKGKNRASCYKETM